MITNEGSIHIKRFLSGSVPDIARSIALGVGEAPASPTDVRLQYEIARVPIELISYDFENNRLIFKGTMEEDFDGTVYEIGLYSREDSSAGAYGSRLITSFDSDTEAWYVAGNPATYTTTNTRIGNDSLTLSPASAASATANLPDTLVDLSVYSAADEFSVAFYNGNTNLSTLSIRFSTDASNYYTISIPNGSITAGFNVVRIAKGTAVATGAPNWGSITEIAVTANSKVGGASAVNFEGIRIEDTDTIDSGYVLVSRAVVALPFVKTVGRTQDIEFPLGVTISG
jgi:hypothetical protein